MRRLLLVLVLIAAFVTPFSRPAPASAAGQILEWESGPGFATFGANASVFIELGTIEFQCDFIFPTANIYVVQGTPGDGAALVDVSGSPNTVVGATGGVFADTIAITQPSGTLGEGVYTVVYDECQDGSFDDGIDAVFPDAFEVVLPSTLPPIDPAIGALKASAGDLADQMTAVLTILALYEAYQEIQEAIECITTPGECVISMIADEFTGAIIDQIRLMLGLAVDPKLAARDAALDTISHWEGIEADPPDPAFEQHTLIERPAAIDPESGNPLVGAEVALGNAHLTEGALAAALLHAIERYQGAQAADDGDWTLVHARETHNFATLMAAQLLDSNLAVANLVNALNADTRDIDQVSATLSADRQRIAASGFLPDEVQELRNLGLGQAGIAALRATIAEQGNGIVSESALITALNGLIAANDSAITEMQALATAMSAVIAAILLDPATDDSAPVADAGGSYTAAEGASLILDGSGSSALVGSLATHAWDLDGDGAFDDASGATPSVSFDEPLDGFIGLKVTDDRGMTGVSYAAINIVSTNSPPLITAVSPDAFHPEIIVGTSQTFSVTATDPDGDGISIAWLLDGESAGSGSSFTYTPLEANGLDGHWLRAAVSAGGDTRVYDWTPLVLLPDVDSDGWRANVDCDDSDVAINPGLSEVLFNGKDDDCNPATADDDEDWDGDGYPGSIDCVDFDERINPGAIEILHNLRDDDCNPDTPDSGPLAPIVGHSLVESIVVSGLGETVLSGQPLQDGVTYQLRAYNTFEIGGPGIADAEYAFTTIDTSVIDGCNGSSFDNLGIHLNGLQDSTGKLPKWGPFNTDHVYTIDFQGDGAPLTIRYVDCVVGPGGAHGDNFGSLTLQIWEPDDIAPSLQMSAGLDQTADEGSIVQLAPATFTGADGAATSATIDWGDGTTEAGIVSQTDDAGTVDGSHVYTDNGNYTVEVCVETVAATSCDSLTVVVANLPPVVEAGNDLNAGEGSTVSLDQSSFTDPGNDIHTVRIAWGDGTHEVFELAQGERTITRSHVYQRNFDYLVLVGVCDDDGACVNDSATASITPVAPVLDPIADITVNVGEPINTTATWTDSSAEAEWTTSVTWGDGIRDGAVLTTIQPIPLVHTYDAAGDYTLNVCVNDGTLFACAAATVHVLEVVANLPPVVDAGPDGEAVTGQPFSRSGSFTDPDSLAWTATIDYGDGSGVEPLPLNTDQTFALTHTYSTAGGFTVTVCVSDENGAQGCDETTISVSAAARDYAIFAGRDDCGSGNTKALEWSGSSGKVAGDIHSNSGLKINGSRNRVDGATTYRCDKHISGSRHTFSGGVTQVSAVQPWPLTITADDFNCDISVSGKLDLSRNGAWWVGGTKHSRTLKPLTLCAGEITLSGSSIRGEVTLVAGKISISGSNLRLTAHEHGVLTFATGDGHSSIKISGSINRLSGDLVARSGAIDLSGSCNTITGSITGWTVKLSGSSWRVGVQ